MSTKRLNKELPLKEENSNKEKRKSKKFTNKLKISTGTRHSNKKNHIANDN